MKAKERMEIPLTEMPTQPPTVRAKNFREVPYGYEEEMAIKEANAIIIAKTSESELGTLKPEECAENVVTYAHALLEEMTKRGL